MTERTRAQEAVRESEARLGFVLEAAQIGEWDLDLATQQARRSLTHDRIFGYDEAPEEWTYEIFLHRHVHPDDRARVDEAFQHTLRTYEDWDFECRIVRTDGRLRWIWARGRVHHDTSGRPVRILGLVQDITARKRAEARDRFRIRLNAALQGRDDPDEIMAIATRELAEHLGADRCAYAEIEADEDRAAVLGEYVRDDLPRLPERLRASDFGDEARRHMLAKRPYIVSDAATDERIPPEARPAYEAAAMRAVVCVPLHKAGRFAAALFVHQGSPREWTPEELELTTEVASRCWETIERARVARDLRDSELRYRSLFTAMDQGFCVIDLIFDEAGRPVDYRFLEQNPAFETLTGLRDAVGRTARELVPGLEPHWFEIYGEVAVTGEPTRFVERSDAMDRWFDVYAFRIGGDDSRRVAVLFTNITDRKRAEEERERLLRVLEHERSRLAAVFREAPALIAVLSGPEHVFEMANPVYYQVVGHRELIGRSVREALPDIADQGFYELLDQVYATGEPFVGRGTRVLLQPEAGGPRHEHYLDFVYQPLRDPDGAVTGIFVHAVDVTDHKRATEALKEAHEEMERRVEERTADLRALNAELESFNYSVSHDLRTPLRGIDGFSQVLLEDYHDVLDDTARGYLRRIRTGTERMGKLIDDLLDLSRLSTGTLERRRVDLSAVAARVVADLRAAEPEHRPEVIVQEGITVEGDEAFLKIALENLLGNAWKFTRKRERARIEFGACERDGERAYRVRDDGAGFDMRYADKLFEPFQRMHSPAEFSGTGIGLAIVQRIVQRHGGRVWAEGTEGEGATFYFTLA